MKISTQVFSHYPLQMLTKTFHSLLFLKKKFGFFPLFFILAEGNRVPLQYVDGVVDSDYINAVFVDVRIGHWFFQLFCEDFPLLQHAQ